MSITVRGQLNVPVFGTLLTLGLLENKLREHKMLDKVRLHTVVPGEKVKLGQMMALEHLAYCFFRHGEAFPFGIGAVAHQKQHALAPQLSKTLKVDNIAVNRP